MAVKQYHVRHEQVEPLSESSDDSEFEIRNDNDRRYPHRRRPPDRYTCN